ncbi:SEL1-like repeat protein [Reyranella sp.]|uniref:SEL1-like repeat protein n=1 Tax=Reyranella sp. TaxID=1929291 RepID=UPI0034285651
MYKLGIMYRDGEGVPNDDVLAFKWINGNRRQASGLERLGRSILASNTVDFREGRDVSVTRPDYRSM